MCAAFAQKGPVHFFGANAKLPKLAMKYFIYCRKSTESEDRQVLSIDSQLKELRDKFASDPEVEIVATYQEAFSAKAPGRQIFDEMLRRIERGDANGLIAWHADRLARNSVDGGRIVHLLDRGLLKDLKFATSSFENTPQGKFMLQIIFGYSKYYVDSLSENVKRGLRAKLDRGWQPNKPPTGYKNDPISRTIVPDPEAFATIAKLFELALTGIYSVAALEKVLRLEWGFRTPRTTRMGGRPLGLTSVFQILHNPFYAGYIRWNGRLYPGKHHAIITWRQFEALNRLITRPTTRRPKRYVFPFTGLIRCGACGFAITAEHKTNRQGHRYIYYHCTRKGHPSPCRQPSITDIDLERQVLNHLGALSIDEPLIKAALKAVELSEDSLRKSLELHRTSLAEAAASCDRRLTAITDMRERDLIDDEELIARRKGLIAERTGLTESLARLTDKVDWFEPVRDILSPFSRATSWFTAGDDTTKGLILKIVGSNPTLKDKILRLDMAFPFDRAVASRSFVTLCRIVHEVRIKFLRGDPHILSLLYSITVIEQSRSNDVLKNSA